MYKGKTVLLVDDDQDFVLQQKASLTALGFTVREAHSLREATENLAALTPDLAIIDLMMEEKDGGFVLAHRIKQKDAAIPVILVTAVTAETGLQFGPVGEKERRWIKADVVLAKPIRFEQLTREIEWLLA